MRLKPASAAALLPRPPVVVRVGDTFVFLVDGREVYDLTPTSPGDALWQIAHLSEKAWVLKRHIRQFASLAAQRFVIGRR